MTDSRPLTILCLASYEKGAEFMRECKRQHCRVLLLTSESIAHADWPRESIDEIFLIPDINKKWKRDDVIRGVSFLARTETIDRIVPLDDFDLETAAALREHVTAWGMSAVVAGSEREALSQLRRDERQTAQQNQNIRQSAITSSTSNQQRIQALQSKGRLS